MPRVKFGYPENQQRGLVGQVPVIGILMIVQGVLLTIVSLFIALYAVMMPRFFDEMQQDMAAKGGNAPPMPPEFGTWFMVAAVLFALAIGAMAVLTILSGVKVIKYRGRTFAIVMLCAGMLSISTCYCFPTALGLGIYGLIVLLNGPVKLAFDLSEQGYDPREVQKVFLMLP